MVKLTVQADPRAIYSNSVDLRAGLCHFSHEFACSDAQTLELNTNEMHDFLNCSMEQDFMQMVGQ